MGEQDRTVEVEVTIMDESDSAYAIANPDEDAPWRNWIWLPKSQVTLDERLPAGRRRTIR